MSDTVVRLTLVNGDHAALVRQVMLAAFEEFRGPLDPPSSALDETLEDTRRAIESGGGTRQAGKTGDRRQDEQDPGNSPARAGRCQ